MAAVDGGCSKNHNKLFLLNFLKKILSNFHLRPIKSESWRNFMHPLSKSSKLVQGWLRFSWIWVGTIFFKWEKEKGWWEDGCRVRIQPKKEEGLRRYTEAWLPLQILVIFISICIVFIINYQITLKISIVLLKSLLNLITSIPRKGYNASLSPSSKQHCFF